MTLKNLKYSPRSDKLVLARTRTIETAVCSSPTRRGLLAGSVAALSVGLFKKVFASSDHPQTMTAPDGGSMTRTSASQQGSRQPADKTAIRPFRVNVPQAKLRELRRRIKATNWPERETVADESQGVQLATMQELARYWGIRNLAARSLRTHVNEMNIEPIDLGELLDDGAGPPVRDDEWQRIFMGASARRNCDPLTNPTAHGASASDAFHLVIPSLPGFGFSARPTTTGWGPDRTARAWIVLMKRLDTRNLCPKVAIWARVSALRCLDRRLRNCWAFTPTSLAPFHSTLRRRSSAAIRRPPVYRRMKNARTSSSRPCLRSDAPTHK